MGGTFSNGNDPTTTLASAILQDDDEYYQLQELSLCASVTSPSEWSSSSCSYRCFGGWIPDLPVALSLSNRCLFAPISTNNNSNHDRDTTSAKNVASNDENDKIDHKQQLQQVPTLSLSPVSSCSTINELEHQQRQQTSLEDQQREYSKFLDGDYEPQSLLDNDYEANHEDEDVTDQVVDCTSSSVHLQQKELCSESTLSSSVSSFPFRNRERATSDFVDMHRSRCSSFSTDNSRVVYGISSSDDEGAKQFQSLSRRKRHSENSTRYNVLTTERSYQWYNKTDPSGLYDDEMSVSPPPSPSTSPSDEEADNDDDDENDMCRSQRALQLPVSPTSVLELCPSSARSTDTETAAITDSCTDGRVLQYLQQPQLQRRKQQQQKQQQQRDQYKKQQEEQQQRQQEELHKRLRQSFHKAEWLESSQVGKLEQAIHVYRNECLQMLLRARHVQTQDSASSCHSYPQCYDYPHYRLTCAHLYIHKIGLLYYRIGNYRRSISSILHGLELVQTYGYGCMTLQEALEEATVAIRAAHAMGSPADTVDHHRLLMLFAHGLVSLGRAYVSLGKAEEAKESLKRALKLLSQQQQTARFASHNYLQNYKCQYRSLFSKGLVTLGTAYELQGRYALAMKHYQNGFEDMIQQQRLYEDASLIVEEDIAGTISSIGGIYLKYGWFQPAMNCYLEALRIYRHRLGETGERSDDVHLKEVRSATKRTKTSPVDIGVTLASIGWIHFLCGEYPAAMKASTHALTIVQELLGKTHRNASSIRFQIGLIMYKQQEHYETEKRFCNDESSSDEDVYIEVLKIFKSVLECQRAVLGDDHDEVAITLDASADVYIKLQRFERARLFLDRALGIRKRVWGEKHMLVGMSYTRLGDLYSEACPKIDGQANHNSHMEMAKLCYSDAVKIYHSNKLRDDDIRLQHCKMNLSQDLQAIF